MKKNNVKIISAFPCPASYRYDEETWYNQHSNDYVIINCQSSRIYYPEHWTPLSIKCVFSGKEFYAVRGGKYAVTADNFLLLNEGCRYASYIQSEDITESFTLNYTPHNVRTILSSYNRNVDDLLNEPFSNHATNTFRVIEKLYEYSPRLLQLISHIRAASTGSVADEHDLQEQLYFVLEELALLQKSTYKQIDEVKALRPSTRMELFRRLHLVKDYINSCYAEDISLEELGRLSCLNPFHLLRAFKKNFHTTPHRYLTQKRLAEAEKLLRTTNKKVSEVGAEVGFEDAASFSKLFKKNFSISPEALKKRNHPIPPR